MKVIGLTGGIGSGKSTVASILKVLGYAVYNSDQRAKFAYEDPAVFQQVIELFGGSVLENHQLVFSRIADLVFNDPPLLAKLNQIVHPWVKTDFDQWKLDQGQSLVFKESALLFETGIYRACDATIWVAAEEALRVQRVMSRDGLTKTQVKARIKRQIIPERALKLADYVLHNNEDFLVPPILTLIKALEN